MYALTACPTTDSGVECVRLMGALSTVEVHAVSAIPSTKRLHWEGVSSRTATIGRMVSAWCARMDSVTKGKAVLNCLKRASNASELLKSLIFICDHFKIIH